MKEAYRKCIEWALDNVDLSPYDETASMVAAIISTYLKNPKIMVRPTPYIGVDVCEEGLILVIQAARLDLEIAVPFSKIPLYHKKYLSLLQDIRDMKEDIVRVKKGHVDCEVEAIDIVLAHTNSYHEVMVEASLDWEYLPW